MWDYNKYFFVIINSSVFKQDTYFLLVITIIHSLIQYKLLVGAALFVGIADLFHLQKWHRKLSSKHIFFFCEIVFFRSFT